MLGDAITGAIGIGPGVSPAASMTALLVLALGLSALTVMVAIVANLLSTRTPSARLIRAE